MIDKGLNALKDKLEESRFYMYCELFAPVLVTVFVNIELFNRSEEGPVLEITSIVLAYGMLLVFLGVPLYLLFLMQHRPAKTMQMFLFDDIRKEDENDKSDEDTTRNPPSFGWQKYYYQLFLARQLVVAMNVVLLRSQFHGFSFLSQG